MQQGIGYHPAFGQHVRYSSEWMPEDSDGQVRQTIQKVIRYIEEDSHSPLIQAEARRMAAVGGGDPILGLWKSVPSSIRFQEDVDTARQLQADYSDKENTVEVLIRPHDQALLIGLRGIGVEDCDGYSMYAACLLTALGIPCSLVTIAADQERPYEFSHVYIAAYVDGKRIPLDFSHGKYPGWEAPHARIKEWPVRREYSFFRALAPILVLSASAWGLDWWDRRRAA